MSASIAWYNVYNRQDFIDEDLVSKELTLDLEDLGETIVLLTQGNCLGLAVDGTFLALELNDKNPMKSGDYLAYVDGDDEIWLGVISAD
jgi:hypothetical protein